MIQEFYYGSSWHWPLPYLPRVMLSYNMLRKIKTLWKIDIPFMMDSGAFAVILKYGKYPFTQEEYASGIQKWHPDIAWTMDYPCEPSVQKKGHYDPVSAQEMTIDNQIKLLDLNANTQMVVQGWTVQDYLENIEAKIYIHIAFIHICVTGALSEKRPVFAMLSAIVTPATR